MHFFLDFRISFSNHWLGMQKLFCYVICITCLSFFLVKYLTYYDKK
jgi:hypothetical protein